MPTETVYGLAADGLNEAAVQKIYDVKGRPAVKPISLLVSGMEQVEDFCDNIPPAAYKLAERFWPGAMTMILYRKPNVPDIVTAGGITLGVRCPQHETTLRIIAEVNRPLATPSANISGEESPKNAQKVLDYFDGKIEAIVDGGECAVGVESTIIDLTTSPPRILRHGGISEADIFAALEV